MLWRPVLVLTLATLMPLGLWAADDGDKKEDAKPADGAKPAETKADGDKPADTKAEADANKAKAATILAKFDADKDGKLNEDELTKALADDLKGKGKKEVTAEMVQHIIKKNDTDKDGKLNADELAKFLDTRKHGKKDGEAGTTAKPEAKTTDGDKKDDAKGGDDKKEDAKDGEMK